MRKFYVVIALLVFFAALLPVTAWAAKPTPPDNHAGRLLPPGAVKVWEVWLNESVDVVNPQPSLRCWDVPLMYYKGASYWGFTSCFMMYQDVEKWILEEWRAPLSPLP
ncbi:TPA: hypothetical protein DCY43_00420 [candidate division WWE3 bacterium]|uniref:Uncharacterized protein n=2 Tax=Bacteria candidate phyla TaxID=1783234 RepID=A0A351JSD6_UNCKA|nr:hypothetical protein [candidate division WWE3 bacterium]